MNIDWLADVPQQIINEASQVGLKITSKQGDPAIAAGVFFWQKGNSVIIKKLESQGWRKQYGQIVDGAKLLFYEKRW